MNTTTNNSVNLLPNNFNSPLNKPIVTEATDIFDVAPINTSSSQPQAIDRTLTTNNLNQTNALDVSNNPPPANSKTGVLFSTNPNLSLDEINNSIVLDVPRTSAASNTVVTNTKNSGTGSLRNVIASAKSGNTITFARSLANRTIKLTSGEIAIAAGKNLTIDGANANNLTISGNNKSRIFRILSNVDKKTKLTVKNLTLTKGFSKDRGGAIQTEDLATLTVNNVTFKDNVAKDGGASIWTNSRSGGVTVLNSRFLNNKGTASNDERGSGGIGFVGFAPGGSALVVKNSDFIGNRGINGAAINVINGEVTIEDSRFINNSTTAAFFASGKPRSFLRGHGGALFIDRADDRVVIRNSVFEGNRAEGQGGAANLFGDPDDKFIIEDTIFRNNRVNALTGEGRGNGGAIMHVRNSLKSAGSFQIRRSSFVNNVAQNQGGGLWVNQTKSEIRNTTFSGNQALDSFGGGLVTYSPLKVTNVTFADNRAEFSGALAQSKNKLATVKNTIFANNTSKNTGVSFNRNQQTNRPIKDGGGNLQSGNGPLITPGILVRNPKLGKIQKRNGTLIRPLQSGSGAIDAGVNSGAPKVDQAGKSRIQDGDGNGSRVTDIGAVEFASSRRSRGGQNSTRGTNNLNGTNQNDILTGLAGNDSLNGKGGNDRLVGGDGRDTLIGGSGSDALIGGNDNDTLTGGSGADSFRFDTRSQGIDTITDFSPTDDRFVIRRDGFGGGLPLGTLKASQFTFGSSAKDNSDRFIYHSSTGDLFFDRDGTGSLAKQKIAVLDSGLSLSRNDFVII